MGAAGGGGSLGPGVAARPPLEKPRVAARATP
jgi:hypothetical protein